MVYRQATSFDVYEMEYRGGPMESDLSLIPFDEPYYGRYKNLVDSCFFGMRKALDIRPYDQYCGPLEELMEQRENIFLLPYGDGLAGAVSCFGNEIDNVVVGLGHRRQGYGRRLMEFAVGHMQRRGDSPIRLTVVKWNKQAVALYRSMGFVAVRQSTVKGVNTQAADGSWSFAFSDTGGTGIR